MTTTFSQTMEQYVVTDPVALSNLKVLMTSGVLNFKSGSITVHYDETGVIRKVENHLVSYKV